MKDIARLLVAAVVLFTACQKSPDMIIAAAQHDSTHIAHPDTLPLVRHDTLRGSASLQTQFSSVFGGLYDEYGLSIAASAGGGFVIAGRAESNDGDVTGNHGSNGVSDGWVVKVDTAGKKVWQKTIGGSGVDIAYNIQPTPDGGYVIAGNTDSNDGDVSGNHGKTDGWIVKLNAAGNMMWQKTLGGTAIDAFSGVVAGSDGTYTVAGMTGSSNGDVIGGNGAAHAWIVKLNATGSIIWQNTVGGVGGDAANSIVGSPDGGYVIAGYTFYHDGGIKGSHGGLDALVAKFDKDGNKIWEKALGGSEYDEARAITAGKDGSFLIAGYTRSSDGDVTGWHGRSDAWVVKLDGNGNKLWQKTLGGTNDDDAFAIAAAPDGGCVIAGKTYSSDGDVTIRSVPPDGWIVKLDASGNKVWQKAAGGNNEEHFQGIISISGGYVAAGTTISTDGDIHGAHGSSDAWIFALKAK